MEKNENLKEIISKNLVKLRKFNKLTQSELAERLNYSDKAISKWERGESLPDLQVLVNLCEIYNITLNDLTKEMTDKEHKKIIKDSKNRANVIILTSLIALSVWLIAACVYAYSNYPVFNNYYWESFVWAIPASTGVIIIMNTIFGDKEYNPFLLSIVTWGGISASFVSLLPRIIWPVFIIGIPIQIAIIIWSRLEH